MKKRRCHFIAALSILLLLVSCRNKLHKSPFFDDLSCYKNDFLYIDMEKSKGTIILYNITIDFNLAKNYNGHTCYFYATNDVNEKIKKYDAFWTCDGTFYGTDLKLVVKRDEIADYTGRTLILYRVTE